jgi:hypothetical protein
MFRILVCASLLTCVFDIYCTVKYADHLAFEDAELNPVAAAFIQIRHEHKWVSLDPTWRQKNGMVSFRYADVSGLIFFKTLGLLGAVYLLECCLRMSNRKIGVSVVVLVFLLQMTLLFVLLS